MDMVLRGVAVGLASSITVGPVAVLCIQRTLSKSRLSGLVSGLGVACADALMAIIAFFFYSILETQIERYSSILQVLGGIFVVIVGVAIFFKNPIPQIRRNRAGSTSLWRDFVSMFTFTLANFIVIIPYLLAFFALFGVGTQHDNSQMSVMRCVMVNTGFLIGATAWWYLLTTIISLFRKRFRPRHMLTINHIAGLVIGILGLYTILSTFITFIPNE